MYSSSLVCVCASACRLRQTRVLLANYYSNILVQIGLHHIQCFFFSFFLLFYSYVYMGCKPNAYIHMVRLYNIKFECLFSLSLICISSFTHPVQQSANNDPWLPLFILVNMMEKNQQKRMYNSLKGQRESGEGMEQTRTAQR